MPDIELTPEVLEYAATLMCERRLDVFAKEAWKVLESGVPFREGRHIEFISRHLEDLKPGPGAIDRVLINVPPGTMKTYLTSIFYPAWIWGPRNCPQARFLVASYGARLASDFSVLCRKLIRSDWYQERWGDRFDMSEAEDEKMRFGNTAGGWRQATSVGSVATGKHPDYIIVDDPISRDHADSATARQEVQEWWSRTMKTRGIGRDVKRIIVMQRLHEDDLSGYVLEKESGWQKIILPMRYEPDRMPDTWLGMNDWREKEGELLWPELFPEPKVKEIEADMDEYTKAGQMQQRPAPIGGGMIKREWFQLVDTAPAQATRVRYWDKAGTEKAGAYTAGVLMSRTPSGTYVIEDVRREQVGLDGRENLILQTAQLDAQRHNNEVTIWHEREPGSAGKDSATLTTRMLAGFPVFEDRPKGDKITRARPFAAQASSGNVKIVKGPWNDDLLFELEQFPNGKYKDQVDACSGALSKLALGFAQNLSGELACSGGEDDPTINPMTEEELEEANPILRDLMEPL